MSIIRVRHNPTFQYVVLSTLCTLTLGLFNTIWFEYYAHWRSVLLVLVALPLCWSGIKNFRRLFSLGILPIVGWIFAACVIVIGLAHQIAFFTQPEDQVINTVGQSVSQWRARNFDFLLFYLFFPVAFFYHRRTLKKCDFGLLIRTLVCLGLISAAVLFYQAFFDADFLHKFENNRYGGLATDLNAFALCAFWLVPLAIVGALRETSRIWQGMFYCSVIVFPLATLLTGTRTVFIGMGLFSFLLAAGVAAFGRGKARIAAAVTATTVLVGATLIVLTPKPLDYLAANTEVALFDRLSESRRRIEEQDISEWFERDYRGRQMTIATGLISEAPLGGWGPGGFYREASNQIFRTSGIKEGRRDSALNHYLMLAGDFGIPVLLLNLALLVLPLVYAFRSAWVFRRERKGFGIAILAMAGIVFMLIIFLQPPAYFPDTVWIWTAVLAFLGYQRPEGAEDPKERLIERRLSVSIACVALAAAGIGAYTTAFGSAGYEARQQGDQWSVDASTGAYPFENWRDGQYRWTEREATLSLVPQTDIIGFDLVTHPHNIRRDDGLTVTISLDGLFTETRQFFKAGRRSFAYYVPNVKGRRINLHLTVSRTFNPKKLGLNNSDNRELGVAISRFRYLDSIPEGGIEVSVEDE